MAKPVCGIDGNGMALDSKIMHSRCYLGHARVGNCGGKVLGWSESDESEFQFSARAETQEAAEPLSNNRSGGNLASPSKIAVLGVSHPLC